jgi:hypothetical protein
MRLGGRTATRVRCMADITELSQVAAVCVRDEVERDRYDRRPPVCGRCGFWLVQALLDIRGRRRRFCRGRTSPLMRPSGLVRSCACSHAVPSMTSSGSPAGGQPVDRRLWTVRHGMAWVNLLRLL